MTCGIDGGKTSRATGEATGSYKKGMFRHPRVWVPGPETLPFLGDRKCRWRSQDVPEEEVTEHVPGTGVGYDCDLSGV